MKKVEKGTIYLTKDRKLDYFIGVITGLIIALIIMYEDKHTNDIIRDYKTLLKEHIVLLEEKNTYDRKEN